MDKNLYYESILEEIFDESIRLATDAWEKGKDKEREYYQDRAYLINVFRNAFQEGRIKV